MAALEHETRRKSPKRREKSWGAHRNGYILTNYTNSCKKAVRVACIRGRVGKTNLKLEKH